jgi:hypothetical protein
VGMPYYSFNILDNNEEYTLQNAGTVFVYKRNPEPSGFDWTNQYDKAEWVLEQQINLPSIFLRDYIDREEIINSIDIGTQILPLPEDVSRSIWKVGQDGRQLGYSLDICSTNNLEPSLGEDKKNILVVGGPSCRFTREFDTVETTPINIGLFVFTDSFQPVTIGREGRNTVIYDYNYVANKISDLDILFRYFSNPPAKFDIKINVLDCKELTGDISSNVLLDSPNFPEPKPSFVTKSLFLRHSTAISRNSPQFQINDDNIFEALKTEFFNSFPYDPSKPNNNIPAIIGFYIDNTTSFGGKRAVNPALDRFIEFYKDYSLASGLKDFSGQAVSGDTIEFFGDQDNWALESVDVLKATLDINRLSENNLFKLFSSDVGNFNSGLPELQFIPYSGGCVYIFEKESGVWNLIQSIESPNKLNNIPPDRFGHAVKISDNGEIIVIGSPYINDAFLAYEYNPSVKNEIYNSLENWLEYRKDKETQSVKYANLYNQFQQLKENSVGVSQLNLAKQMYLNLSRSDKYRLRSDYDFWNGNLPQEYQLTFSFPYSASMDLGGWQFLVEEFAPTSRLGYSVAVNEDGSTIAVGAPTDSLNELNDSTSYFAPNRPQFTTWHSYVNTGSVRLFESRKYFPHNLVIEYGKFGNQQYDAAPEEEKRFYDHFERIYQQINVPYKRTEFTDVNIPEEAGLVFIITPYIDALSNEILSNIKNWLALGDRHLVIVGNDPIWERDGKNQTYEQSNNLVNKILRSLDSKFILQPARNRLESLTFGSCPDKVNVIPSFKPSQSLPTYIQSYNLHGYGVGDIKPYAPGTFRSYSCSDSGPLSFSSIFGKDLSYGSANDKCEMTIKHLGDLRSEWKEYCIDEKGEPITYPINWPLVLGAVDPRVYGCQDIGNDKADNNKNITPLLVAAEYPKPFNITYPAVPATSGLVVVDTQCFNNDEVVSLSFSTDHINQIVFQWASGINASPSTFTSFNSNVTNVNTNSKFFGPTPFTDDDGIIRSSMLRAEAESKIEILKKDKVVSNKSFFAASEVYDNTSSQIILLAGTSTEKTLGPKDIHCEFYNNLLSKNRRGDAYIAQIGGWTGRSSFTDLTPDSILDVILSKIFNTVNMNVDPNELLVGSRVRDQLNNTESIYEYDVCWLAEPIRLPTASEANIIKEWLSRGNKKLVITYATYSKDILDRISELCSIFNVSMRPLFLPVKEKYPNTSNLVDFVINVRATDLVIDENSFVSNRFVNDDDPANILLSIPLPDPFTPIEINNSKPIAFIDYPVIDDEYINNGFWELKTGFAEIKVPTIPGSGYRLFINGASSQISQNQPLKVWLSESNIGGADTSLFFTNKLGYIDDSGKFIVAPNTKPVSSFSSISPSNFKGELFTTTINFQAWSNETSIYIEGNNPRLFNVAQSRQIPSTTNIVSISGCPLPINTNFGIECVNTIDWVITQPEEPAKTIQIIPEFRPISTDNTKYCPSQQCIPSLGNKLIADGPVVAAQEIENFSSFEYGVNRSRITVISDSSILQGKCIANNDGVIYDNNIRFLQSLYPFTNFPSTTRGRSFTDHITRIQLPERMTPQRLFNISFNEGHNIRFQSPLPATGGRPLSNYVESFDAESFVPALGPKEGKEPDFLERRELPISDEQLLILKNNIKTNFRNSTASWGGYSKFAGIINGKYYEDANVLGGMPQIMQDTGFDYLDFDKFPYGYPGDLFGYSIDLYGDKLLVGTPFSTFNQEKLLNWNDINVLLNFGDLQSHVEEQVDSRLNNLPFNPDNVLNFSDTIISGVLFGYNGGAGAAYLFEKDINARTIFNKPARWSCSRKFRPATINFGSGDSSLSVVNDQFGHSVQIYSDMIAIGSPGHDYSNYIEEIYDSGAFIRKEFDSSLDIATRDVYDLGSEENRNALSKDGEFVLNNGAIFTYENRITDWQNKKQTWEFIEKIVPQGYFSRIQDYMLETPVTSRDFSILPFSSTDIMLDQFFVLSDNDRFGSNITLSRSKRTDSDYTLVAGTPNHKYPISFNTIDNAGAVYVYDGMLRRTSDSTADENAFIQAKVFGLTNNNDPSVHLTINNAVLNKLYSASGIIYSNDEGEIFLEASGQDFTDRTYITHRPYIQDITGNYVFGVTNNDNLGLFINGIPQNRDEIINLFCQGADRDNVYNTLGLYTNAESGIVSQSEMTLYTRLASEPDFNTLSPETLTLSISGVDNNIGSMFLRIRGK